MLYDDERRRAATRALSALFGDLMTVTCAESDARPVVSTYTLYH